MSRWSVLLKETEEERLVRQEKQAKELEVKRQKAEQQRLRKLSSDKFMIQETSSSTTDSKGRHHVTRNWKIVQLK